MRAWLSLSLLLAACGSTQAPAPEPAERPAATPAPEASAAADEGPVQARERPTDDATLEIGSSCHVSCCNDAILALQAASDDPSIANECCFCE